MRITSNSNLQQHLLLVDISFWITDVRNLTDRFDNLLVESVHEFLFREFRAEATA